MCIVQVYLNVSMEKREFLHLRKHKFVFFGALFSERAPEKNGRWTTRNANGSKWVLHFTSVGFESRFIRDMWMCLTKTKMWIRSPEKSRVSKFHASDEKKNFQVRKSNWLLWISSCVSRFWFKRVWSTNQHKAMKWSNFLHSNEINVLWGYLKMRLDVFNNAKTSLLHTQRSPFNADTFVRALLSGIRMAVRIKRRCI